MSYRNKTYVAFASEDIDYYWLMKAWHANRHIDFDFINAHDIYQARDSSTRETIKRRLRDRLNNTKQVVLLGSPAARLKGSDGYSFLAYEIDAALSLNLPVVVANLNKSRRNVSGNIPTPFADVGHFTMSVAFGPTIIKYALDHYVPDFASSSKTGAHYYKEWVYEDLGLNN